MDRKAATADPHPRPLSPRERGGEPQRAGVREIPSWDHFSSFTAPEW